MKALNEKSRLFPRAVIQGEVLIHDESRLYQASLNNISAGGIFVNKLVSLTEGSMVRMVVKSCDLGETIQVMGKVCRVEVAGNRCGLAVEFISMTSKAREVIQNCVSQNQIGSV